MAAFTKLKDTPIKEIIFTISFKENVEETNLTRFCELPTVKEQFPITNTSFNAEVKTVNNEAPTTQVKSDGFILRNATPHSKLIQAKKGSFSFHLINLYQPFDLIIEELNVYWKLLEECCGNLSINGLMVRYLNFIELKDGDNVEKLITINTSQPFGTRLENSFTNLRFVYEKNPDITVNIVTTTGKTITTPGQSDFKDGIILDIIVNKRVLNSVTPIFDNFKDMREAKNETFFKSITEETIKRYN